MKILPKSLVVTLSACALLLLAGCPKKPNRAAPLDTSLGQSAQDTTVIPKDLVADQDSLLTPRDPLPPGWIDEGAFYRGVMESVYFDFDRAAVSSKERPKIEAAVKWMKENPDKRVVLEGHCDWRGTAEYNLGLGDRRANAVRRYLESLGVDSKRLEIISKGDIDAKEGGTEAEMAKDRRVDFLVLK
jgi:peptidoglycan-associated lipoprotein